MQYKILTANIAFGLLRMDIAWWNIWHHVVFHGINILFFAVTNALGIDIKYSLAKRPDGYRMNYLRRNSSLVPILNIIKEEDPDVVVLNELIYQIHKEGIEGLLKEQGFSSFSWACMSHHKEATVTTLVAYKGLAESFQIEVPQRFRMGCGGSVSMLRINDYPLTIFGVHLGHPYTIWRDQLQTVSEIVKQEIERGYHLIVAGDFNRSAEQINSEKEFASLELTSVNKNTEPTFVLAPKTLDHIFVQKSTIIDSVQYTRFGSDHVAITSILRI